MTSPVASRDASNRPLSAVLKAIRRRRGLRSSDVARAMKLPLRTFEHFESGQGRLDPERVQAFAQATDADPYAILLSLEIGSPAFALRCMDNKLATILLMCLQEFDGRAADQIAALDARTLITAFTRAFDELTTTARQREAFIEQWMFDKSLGGDPGAEPDEPD